MKLRMLAVLVLIAAAVALALGFVQARIGLAGTPKAVAAGSNDQRSRDPWPCTSGTRSETRWNGAITVNRLRQVVVERGPYAIEMLSSKDVLKELQQRGVHIVRGITTLPQFQIMLFNSLIVGLSLAVQITEGTTNVGAVTIHYLEAGPANSTRALVLIPGWRLPAYLWTEQLTRFGAHERVIAIDPRSQGPSTKTTDGNTPESRAVDLHGVLANLGVAHATLVGWSQGAQDVAAYLAQFGTSTIDGIVLVDSPVSWGPAEVDAHPTFSKAILGGIPVYARSPEEYSRGMVRSIFVQPHPDLDIDKIVKATMQTPPDIGVAMLVQDIFGADRRPALRALDKPALIIAATKGPLYDLQKEEAATIPGARFVPVENSGHAIMVDQPAQFDSVVAAFQSAGSNK